MKSLTKFLSIFFYLIILSNFNYTTAISQELNSQTNSAKYPAFSSNHPEMVFLAVDKSQLKAELILWPEDPKNAKVIGTFKIAIGKELGDKQTAGDNRTPEGIYFAQQILEKKDLLPKYGPNAITLNYPNPIDRYFGKTGSGIWLHGVINDQRVEEATVTEGCVAFYNADIVKLTQWLKPFQGVVIIGATRADINNLEEVLSLKQITQEWINAWASRDIDKYISYYASDFKFEDKNKDKYYQYKRNVFRSYKKMIVNMSQLRIFVHKKYGMSIMNQDFFGDKRFSSLGRKILYWIKENGEWKILREIFEGKRIELINYDEAKLSVLSSKSSVSAL